MSINEKTKEKEEKTEETAEQKRGRERSKRMQEQVAIIKLKHVADAERIIQIKDPEKRLRATAELKDLIDREVIEAQIGEIDKEAYMLLEQLYQEFLQNKCVARLAVVQAMCAVIDMDIDEFTPLEMTVAARYMTRLVHSFMNRLRAMDVTPESIKTFQMMIAGSNRDEIERQDQKAHEDMIKFNLKKMDVPVKEEDGTLCR